MTPEPLDAEDMPEIPDEYVSEYPVDDRHLMDAIYRNSISNGERIEDMYGTYRTLKIIGGIIVSAIITLVFAMIVATMAGVL